MVVYKIINKVNGKMYIGQTKHTAEHRFKKHIADALIVERSFAIHNAIRKYGVNNFEIQVLAKCYTLAELNHREMYYIKLFKTLYPAGYNLDGGGKNYEMHPSTKVKISISKTGKKIGPCTEERKHKISIANKGRNKGIPLSEEHKLKISQSTKGEKNHCFGKHLSDETKKKLSNANSGKNSGNYGKKLSEEAKKHLSEIKMGNKNMLGKKHTEESKNLISRGHDKNKIKILCINNNIIYDSINAASKTLGVERCKIKDVIRGKRNHVKGFVFKKV